MSVGIALPLTPWMLILLPLVIAGGIALIIAIVNERRMQRHRQPGVSYWDVTLRRDGAWRRTDLFTDAGLAFQRRAAKWGMIGAASLLAALIILALIRIL